MSSLVLTVFSLSIILFQISCKKDAAAQTTTLTKDQILVAKTWKVSKLHHVLSGKYSSYTSAGTNTTGLNYDVMRFTFKADGTGTNITVDGTSFPFTWQFSSPDKRSMSITLNGTTVTWEMLEIVDNYLHASVNLTLSGNSDNLETFRLIQVP